MAHDVFISYSRANAPIAEAVRAQLEGNGVRCWIDTRDIPPGRKWADELVDGINNARLLLLVFSSDANESQNVLAEVLQAADSRVPILPFRVEDQEPSRGLGLYVRLTQWLDGIPPPVENHLQALSDAALSLLGKAGAAPKAPDAAKIAAGGNSQLVPELLPTDEPLKTLLSYLHRFHQEVEERFGNNLVRPDRMYVPQFAVPFGGDSAGVDLEEVARAFWSGKMPRVAVLGNYGTGKTHFSWRAALDQIARCESDRDVTIPILYPLRAFSYADTAEMEGRGRDLIDQILAYARSIDFPRVDRRRFIRWLEDGRVGVILDGLDELVIPPDTHWRDVIDPLTSIDGARVLITGRTVYFKDPERELEGSSAFELQAWGKREWEAYVDRLDESGALKEVGGREPFVQAVVRRPSLASLTTRPLWCYMIASIAEEIPQLEDLALAGLYQRFLDRAVRRRALATARLPLVWQFRSMERFAEECIRAGESSLPENRLQSLLDGLFESIDTVMLREYLIDDVRKFAFLNCDRSRLYSFGHKSFEDFFLASACARWLAEQATGVSSGPRELVSRTAMMEERRLSEGQLTFLIGIVQIAETSRPELVPESARPRLHSKILRFLERQLQLEEGEPVYRTNIFRVYEPLLRDSEPRPQITGIALREMNLAGMDLSNCDFRKVDFSGATLFDANFSGSTFDGSSFFGAAVDGAVFDGADLSGADLVGIELEREGSSVFASAKGIDQAKLGRRERRLLSLDA
jgi:hypothetical protein